MAREKVRFLGNEEEQQVLSTRRAKNALPSISLIGLGSLNGGFFDSNSRNDLRILPRMDCDFLCSGGSEGSVRFPEQKCRYQSKR